MSGDEVFVTVASVLLGPGLWVWWWVRARAATPLRGRRTGAGAIAATVAGCGALIFVILKLGASLDVRNAPQYLLMYVVLGLAWLRLAEMNMAYAGISVRDDVIERRNRAAIPATVGGLVGVTLCYAGGNIGNGPGWWVVVFAAALATGTLAVARLVHERLTAANDVVTIDRDPSAGVRMGAFLAACGLLLGRAVAGDWVSALATVRDYARFLPAVAVLVVLGVVIERIARPTPERPRAPMSVFGTGVAIVYLGFAAAYVAMFEWPV